MSILNAVRAWNDIEKFKEELHTYPDEILDKIFNMIRDEQNVRLKIAIEQDNFPDISQEELGMKRIEGIKAYKNRTNLDLKMVLEIWRHKVENFSLAQ